MRKDPVSGTLKPFDFEHIMDAVPELDRFSAKIDSFTFDPLIDSSDIEPAIWLNLARIIKDKYEDYDGFVVLHGTDTMSYSASALSFILDNLEKPVIFTGSQLPIGAPRTDGRENIVSSIEIATAKDKYCKAMVPEVCVFFNSKLIRGNRSTKVNAEHFDAFYSANYPPLAEAGITIKYYDPVIRKISEYGKPLEISTKLDTRVSILKLHPGITEQVVRNILCGPETRAVILETFGSGNAPSKSWFLDIVKEAADMDKILLNVTQCTNGSVNMDIYETGKQLENLGVVSGHDSTTESALAKLFYLMGQSEDNAYVRSMLGRNLRGEISL